MPWWALGLSQMTFWFDMTGTMIIASFLFLLGPRGIWIELRGGAGLVLVFLMLWAGKWHRRSGVITGAEWMIFRFGRDRWGHFARLMSVVSNVVINLALLAYSFKGAGLFLSMFLPFSPLVCSLIMMLVTALYTIESGFYGVIFSDIFQSVCIWIGVVAIVIVAVGRRASPTSARWPPPSPGTGLAQRPAAGPTDAGRYEQYSFLLMMSLFYLGKTLIRASTSGPIRVSSGPLGPVRPAGLPRRLVVHAALTADDELRRAGILLVKDIFPDQTVWPRPRTLSDARRGRAAERVAGLLARVITILQTFPLSSHGPPHLLGPDWGSS
jgi:hypothetical protein